jgi:peptidoglycan hydrolase-like protein with peptidoglycan-binding domain
MKSSILLVGAALLASAAGAPAAMAQTAPVLTYVQPLTPAAIRTVQDRLRQAGTYAGQVDGIWGADSQAALERFQQTHGLQVTGQLNQATAATLGVAPADLLAGGQAAPGGVAGAAPATAAPGALSPDAVRAVQNRLRQLNFYSGGVDGVWGADTQAAIERFQQGRGLQATGQLNPATIAALGLDPNSFLVPTPH